jgi:hypothetical protein
MWAKYGERYAMVKAEVAYILSDLYQTYKPLSDVQ